MNDQSMREKLHHAMDTRLSGVEGDPFLAGKIMARTVRKSHLRLRTAAVAAMVIVMLAGVALGAAYHWRLGEYFGWVGMNAPADFETGYDQQLEMRCGDLTFRIRDAFATANALVGLVEITRTDGGAALFLPYESIFGPESSLAVLYKDADEHITVGAYAAEKGLPIRYANCSFVPEEGVDTGSGDMWMEEDRTLVYYTTSDYVYPTEGSVTVNWTVNMQDKDGRWQSATRKITLPVQEETPDWWVYERVDAQP